MHRLDQPDMVDAVDRPRSLPVEEDHISRPRTAYPIMPPAVVLECLGMRDGAGELPEYRRQIAGVPGLVADAHVAPWAVEAVPDGYQVMVRAGRVLGRAEQPASLRDHSRCGTHVTAPRRREARPRPR